jgi:hypothetical protein
MKREFPDEAAHLLSACYVAVASSRPLIGNTRADLAHALRGIIAAISDPSFAATNAEHFRRLASKLAPELDGPTAAPDTKPAPTAPEGAGDAGNDGSPKSTG